MRVIRAEAMGMCFGVRDALQTLDTLSNPEDITIYGELVHNEHVNTALAQRGFTTLQEGKRSGSDLAANVVITAHGISNSERRHLLAQGKTLIDTTCPLVQRVHDTAIKLESDGWFIIVLGQPQHVEVRGITGDLTSYAVVSSKADVRTFPHERIAILCQTTTRPQAAEELTSAIYDANPHSKVRYVDTICRPTRDRQLAAERLVEQVDALVVVGGKHSNNTRQLVTLAQLRGLPVTHVQSAADLEPVWFTPFHTVGVTAGTSTLPETIEGVCNALESMSESAPLVSSF